jgi:hypothetical protein
MQTFLAWLIRLVAQYVLSFFWKQAQDLAQDYVDRLEREKINKENLKKYEEAVRLNLPEEERLKRGEALLNGTKQS